ncbi:hypothetical protein PR048_014045 [Dryococelus australis]|uniref:Uncharacterized protein n=1 Tax=Dryococelus australis TaxID=614101 RepID=A0ABQ9HUC8_9NEOP|nr:hypothetical protein PR048_014045 [Dryococelus australis]
MLAVYDERISKLRCIAKRCKPRGGKENTGPPCSPFGRLVRLHAYVCGRRDCLDCNGFRRHSGGLAWGGFVTFTDSIPTTRSQENFVSTTRVDLCANQLSAITIAEDFHRSSHKDTSDKTTLAPGADLLGESYKTGEEVTTSPQCLNDDRGTAPLVAGVGNEKEDITTSRPGGALVYLAFIATGVRLVISTPHVRRVDMPVSKCGRRGAVAAQMKSSRWYLVVVSHMLLDVRFGHRYLTTCRHADSLFFREKIFEAAGGVLKAGGIRSEVLPQPPAAVGSRWDDGRGIHHRGRIAEKRWGGKFDTATRIKYSIAAKQRGSEEAYTILVALRFSDQVGGNLNIEVLRADAGEGDMSVEQRQNARVGETADTLENLPTSGIAWQDSRMRISGADAAGNLTRFALIDVDPLRSHSVPIPRSTPVTEASCTAGAPKQRSVANYAEVTFCRGSSDADVRCAREGGMSRWLRLAGEDPLLAWLSDVGLETASRMLLTGATSSLIACGCYSSRRLLLADNAEKHVAKITEGKECDLRTATSIFSVASGIRLPCSRMHLSHFLKNRIFLMDANFLQ